MKSYVTLHGANARCCLLSVVRRLFASLLLRRAVMLDKKHVVSVGTLQYRESQIYTQPTLTPLEVSQSRLMGVR